MTNSNSHVNGASLEDCHTNFFALTDLCGIKWRSYRVEHTLSTEPLDDPVVLSCSQCVAHDVLAVWRRVQLTNPPPSPDALSSVITNPAPPYQQPANSTMYKELWVFWYGDEPEFNNLLSPQLQRQDEGNWESGLSYECRSLLFKALHKFIERCLLSRGFVKIGKWFTQPYTNNDRARCKNYSTNLSFAFSFFVHGESTVCASVQTRLNLPLCRLTRAHLASAATAGSAQTVVLAPHGLAGRLTGASWRVDSPGVRRLLDMWRQLYPLDARLTAALQSGREPLVPPLVEVIVGDVRMKYLSCYVLVCDSDTPCSGTGTQQQSAPLSPCPAPATAGHPGSVTDPSAPFLASTHPLLASCDENTRRLSASVPAHVRRQAAVGVSLARGGLAMGLLRTARVAGCPGPEVSADSLAESLGHWDFLDPGQRTSCSCSVCRRKLRHRQQQSTNKRPEKERPPRIRVGAWHRRPPPTPTDTDSLLSSGLERMGVGRSPQRPAPPAYYRGTATAAPCSSYVVDSPASIGQSPLATPHSNQSVLGIGEAASSSIASPHPATPRTPSTTALPASGGPGSCAPGPASAAATPVSCAPVYSPYLKAPSSQQALSNSPCRADSPLVVSTTPSTSTTATSSTSSDCRRWPAPPRLPSPPPLEHHPSDHSCNLYNFSDLQLWLKCPLKKEREMELLLQQKDALLTTGGRAVSSDPLSNACGVKTEPGLSRGVKRAADPYEFDDDPSAARAATPLECESKSEVSGVGGSRSRPVSEDSLFTSAGLQPKLADLENLFDDRDSDDAVDGGTAGGPGSVSAPGGSESPICTTGTQSVQFADEPGATVYSGPTGCAGVPSGYGGSGVRVGAKCLPSAASALTSVELSKIYPTPPSHEHNHNPSTSPLCQSDQTMTDVGSDQCLPTVPAKQEPGGPCTPDPLLAESIDCLGPVYRPVTQCVLFSSARYAPLTSLPSQCLPGIGTAPAYRPSWLASPQPSICTPSSSSAAAPGMISPAACKLPSVRHSSVTGAVHAVSTVQPPLGSGGVVRPGVSPVYDNPGSLKSVGPASVGAGPRSDTLLSPVSPFISRRSTCPDAVGAHTVEVPALLFNVLLEDSLLSLFHDHNFDMCTMCVCNASADRVGNIRGREAALYIPTSGGALLGSRQRGVAAPRGQSTSFSDEPAMCRCGYSAVVGRRLAYRSGLFVEDEVELTGERREVSYEPQRPPLSALLRGTDSALPPETGLDSVGVELLQLLRQQCSSWSPLDPPTPALDAPLPLQPSQQQQVPGRSHQSCHLQFCDSSEVVRSAVDMLRTTVSPLSSGQQAATVAATVAAVAAGVDLRVHWPLHAWPFSPRPSPLCSQDVVRVMRSLQPLLQDAVQKRRQTRLWESPYQVSGPLTWRQFHRLAGRGTDDHCSPQPVPTLLVGHEGEWLATSPFSLRHWHTLLLQPVASPRHVAYLVVTPAGDNEFVLARVRDFFRELSSTYQASQLGRHSPLGSQLPDGVLRINRTAAVKLANLSVDTWFNQLGDSQLAVKLKLYAQYCLHYVGPYLQTLMESCVSTTGSSSILRDRPSSSPMPPPATPDAPSTPKQTDDDGVARPGEHSSSTTSSSSPSSASSASRQQHQEQPHMVLYFVDPFSYGAESAEMNRLVNLAMMRAYLHMRSSLPQHMQRNINLQVVSLQSILTAGLDVDSNHQRALLRSLALSVYSQCAEQPYQHLSANSLTGFGPSANSQQLLKGKQETECDSRTSPLYSSALCVLAPLPDPQRETDALSTVSDSTRTLFCAYCLTADQNLLLASCTDARGLLRCSTAINVRIPSRLRRRKVSARRLSVQKLMDWLAGIMVQSMHPWRLVVGRLGRIGHGELKSWSSVLSRRSLTRFTNQLRELCGRCRSADACSVLSACLVSLEPDPCHCVLADQCSPEEPPTGSGALRLSTPHDVTCTHIMVFPTSAMTQCAQTAFQQEHISALGNEFIEEDFLDVINGDDDDVLSNNLFDEFNWEDNDMDADRSAPGAGPGDPLGVGSLGAGVGPGSGAVDCGGMGGVGVSGVVGGCGDAGGDGGRSGGDERGEEIGSVLQQPLALGYMPSTAEIGAVPDWFWANAEEARQRHARGQGPVFLRAALHLHCQTHCSDDMLQQQQSQSRGHPLDSDTTTDVLRYVLENYNRLSWLVMDPVSHDRRSCLPIHMQLLLQLYSGVSSVV